MDFKKLAELMETGEAITDSYVGSFFNTRKGYGRACAIGAAVAGLAKREDMLHVLNAQAFNQDYVRLRDRVWDSQMWAVDAHAFEQVIALYKAQRPTHTRIHAKLTAILGKVYAYKTQTDGGQYLVNDIIANLNDNRTDRPYQRRGHAQRRLAISFVKWLGNVT